MSARPVVGPMWLVYLELACAVLAGGLWYAFPNAGPWPLAVALAPWLARLLLTRRIPERTVYDPLLVLFLLSAGLGVWSAYDSSAAWQKFWLIVGGVLLFYALARAGALGARRIWLLALFGAGVALYFLATHDWEAYPAKIGFLTRLGRALQGPLPVLPGHRLHPNVAGGIMAMMFPFAAWVTAEAYRAVRAPAGTGGEFRSQLKRMWGQPGQSGIPRLVLGLGVAALTLFGLLMTTSRGAWIALACALLLASLWALLGRLGAWIATRRLGILLGLLGLLFVAILAAGAFQSAWLLAVMSRIPGPDTGVPRVDLLRNSLALARDYPILGAGLSGFMMLYSTYGILLHVGYTVHSHNLLLNVAVEQGLPASLILVAMWLVFVWVARSWLYRRGNGADRLQVASVQVAALSLTVLLVHGLVDDVLFGSRAVLLLFVPLALAPGLPPADPKSSRILSRQRLKRVRPLLLPATIIALMIAALVWRNPILSRISSNLGAVHQSQIELAAYSWPEWPLQDEVRRYEDLSLPVAEFERALSLDARNPTANRRLGMIELARGEYEAALLHLEAAYRTEPGNVATRQLLGEALVVNGRFDEGAVLWTEVSNAQRQLELRVWWYGHIGEDRRADLLKAAMSAEVQEP